MLSLEAAKPAQLDSNLAQREVALNSISSWLGRAPYELR